ncbi:MAG: hypothetical protein Q7U68_01955, partial [Candidatus Roizmanbacteria bacterium]|nr:hypothetical protein [Candidatus Roizmanbacteria bacterium]
MQYKDKTKEQLMNELAEPHQPIKELQARETDRRLAEEALLKAGHLQSAIFNSANFSSIATDAKGV